MSVADKIGGTAVILESRVLNGECWQSLMDVPGIEELLAGMAAYTQRHIARMDRLLRSSFLVDYTLARLQVVTPLPASSQVGSHHITTEAGMREMVLKAEQC